MKNLTEPLWTHTLELPAHPTLAGAVSGWAAVTFEARPTEQVRPGFFEFRVAMLIGGIRFAIIGIRVEIEFGRRV